MFCVVTDVEKDTDIVIQHKRTQRETMKHCSASYKLQILRCIKLSTYCLTTLSYWNSVLVGISHRDRLLVCKIKFDFFAVTISPTKSQVQACGKLSGWVYHTPQRQITDGMGKQVFRDMYFRATFSPEIPHAPGMMW